MIYNALELKLKLRHLTLVGQDEDGSLEWVGTSAQWNECEITDDMINDNNF